ncbi:MAG: PmoA family protein [Spirochaetia bacterium]|nr:PmoA family protein [Spirochaetia bacterium]
MNQIAEKNVSPVRQGVPHPLVTQNAEPGKRPFLHPLYSPDGAQVLTENEPAHHPWQHGLYIGLNDINGFGFWSEGKASNNLKIDGSFQPEAMGAPVVAGNRTEWAVANGYLTPTGEKLLRETQVWSLETFEDHYTLDLTWTLAPENETVVFGRYDYGGLFLRRPVYENTVVSFLTSGGHKNCQTSEGQRFTWCALSLKENESWTGLAIFDHPVNLGYPTPWRIDGQYGIGPSPCRLGQWSLEQGESKTFRYRVLAYLGQPETGFLENQFVQFSKLKQEHT